MAAVGGDTLDGVSATSLWTLYYRASEANRSDGVIRDPWAVMLFDAISYDYGSSASRTRRTGCGLRASVVALAEGFRRGFSVDLDAAGVADELTGIPSISAGHGPA